MRRSSSSLLSILINTDASLQFANDFNPYTRQISAEFLTHYTLLVPFSRSHFLLFSFWFLLYSLK